MDDGSLPLDPDGQLPFFFLDAHEEPGVPGVVYVFGKVRVEPPLQSSADCAGHCCVGTSGCARFSVALHAHEEPDVPGLVVRVWQGEDRTSCMRSCAKGYALWYEMIF